MLERYWHRRDDEEGFTLIELMVVVLIIGILIAIALPTFLGARQRAQDRAAQSNLRNALAAAKTHFTDGDTYAGFTAAAAEVIEPSLTWADATPPVLPGTVNIAVIAPDSIVMNALSDSGTFFCIADNVANPSSGTTFDEGAAAADVDTLAECVASSW